MMSLLEFPLAVAGCVGVADVLFFGGAIGVKLAAMLKLAGGIKALVGMVKAKL